MAGADTKDANISFLQRLYSLGAKSWDLESNYLGLISNYISSCFHLPWSDKKVCNLFLSQFLHL